MSARHLACLAGTAFALLSTGCAAMKETWNYEPVVARSLSDGTPPVTVAAAPACRVPLRVAVKPFHSARVGGAYGVGGAAGWMLGGFLISAPTGIAAEWTESDMKEQLVMYRHSETRTWAYALYDELVHTGCFEDVAFDPFDDAQYDLVFDADVVRHGKLVHYPFVPLPLWIGTITSIAAESYDRMIEMDVHAKSWAGKTVLDYGFQAVCAGGMTGCGAASATGEVTTILHDGFGEMLSRLSAYFASRSAAYWKLVQERRIDQQRAKLDPDLPALDAVIHAADAKTKGALQAEHDRRVARLDAMLDEDRHLEHQWAGLSLAIFNHQVDEVNAEVDEIYTQRMVAAAVAAVSAGVSAGSAIAHGGPAPSALKVQADVQANFKQALDTEKRVLGWVDEFKSALGVNIKPGDPLQGRIDEFTEALRQRSLHRAQALAEYQAACQTPEQVVQRVAMATPSKGTRKKGTAAR